MGNISKQKTLQVALLSGGDVTASEIYCSFAEWLLAVNIMTAFDWLKKNVEDLKIFVGFFFLIPIFKHFIVREK